MRQNSTLLILFVCFFNFFSVAQVTHTVYSIPFQNYPVQSTPIAIYDDRYSQEINLPFTFQFYGINYNSLVIGTNGVLSFNTALANTLNPYSFTTPIPNINFPIKNAILGAYHDLYLYGITTPYPITYGIVGNAPHRKFVVNFYQNYLYGCATTLTSSFQMILHESTNFIDVMFVNVQPCPSWNYSRILSGLINADGTLGVAPISRNLGSWSATNEGHRYSRAITESYMYMACDNDIDGVSTFSLDLIRNEINPTSPSSVLFYPSTSDLNNETNEILSSSYTSLYDNQIILAVNNGEIINVFLVEVGCTLDDDQDSIPNYLEDINNDGNLFNDDTDMDGFANFIDNDDDNDLVLTVVEYVNIRSSQSTIIDTDNDGIPNYLDNDDDNDGVLTKFEDYNGNGNPADDDTNANGSPDYLENAVALGIAQNENAEFSIYPNPVNDQLFIQNPNQLDIQSLLIYNANGALVKEVKTSFTSISINDLAAGLYLVQVKTITGTSNVKFVKR
ncbi:T9SS type A sorting domain-containing protein [Flavobacterium stagni]|uniref:T9SS type A sorting domain-containing protein n=1 Tax=Flavobacterium stagni TaxID=2506421 RepID=A0A4Q1K7W4_9FLAO|nr:T9SS type A sorting domain-containing protein [Flavobacterium stagni]RXR21833.1 T9SS type A sorting domain-containing protein [Flavobacterium stagni]